MLITGGTPKNGVPKAVHSRMDTADISASSAQAGGDVYVSKAAPGRTFFDDIFNVRSCFLYLILQSHNTFTLLPPLPLDFSRFSLFSFPRPFLQLSFLSPYFLFSSPISIFSSFLYFSLSFTLFHIRPPLWSSGQSFWLQIQRSRVRSPALPDFE